MYQQLRVAVVVPAYNEQRAIGDTIATIPSFVERVIVVDDASHDDTALNAAAAATRREAIPDSPSRVVRHKTNRGVGAAIATGYHHAFDDAHGHGVDVAVVMAGDGQMDPGDLPALLEPIATGEAGYVKGNRFKHPSIWTTMPASRIVGNVLLSAATRVTSGYHHVFDSQCGYTAMSREAFERIEVDELWIARYTLSQRPAVAATRRRRARRRRAGAPDLRRALEERDPPRHRARADPVGVAAQLGLGASRPSCPDAEHDHARRPDHDELSALARRDPAGGFRPRPRRPRCARSATMST